MAIYRVMLTPDERNVLQTAATAALSFVVTYGSDAVLCSVVQALVESMRDVCIREEQELPAGMRRALEIATIG